MSIRAYSSIVENISSSNYFDIYDENLSKIRFTLRDQQLYITSYNSVTNTWFPATVNFDNAPAQSTSIIDYQDILSSNNIRIQLNAELPINGKELLIFENDNNYNIIKSSGLNYAINSSQYLPTTNLDNRLVVYELDSNGKPRLTLSSVSSNNFASTFVTLANNQTINSAKTFGLNSLLLGGNGGNITLNGSQTVSSSSYSLEYPTASPSGVLNVLTTSGSSPFSKLTWTELSSYALLSNFDQLTALKTIGSPTFANLTINTGGALNLNYISTPASSDILATLNTNKQLTNSGVSLATLCTLGNTQTFTADKTFNYSSGKIKLSNYSTDNTSTNNILMLNSSGYIVPCNKLYSDITSSQTISGDIVDIASSQTITGNKTLSGSTTISGTVTLSGVNADTATSSGQKLAVLNTTSNGVERVNITPDTLVTTSSGTQTIAGNKTFSGTNSFSSSGNTFKTNLGIIGSTSGTLTFSPSAITTNYELTFPAAASSVTKGALTSNASGVLSWEDFSSYTLLSGTQTNSAANTWSGNNIFNVSKFILSGNGGNLTLNASQTVSSSAYTLEYPTAAPSGVMNVLTTSGSTPFSKYTWTDLSTYLTSATAASTYVALTGTQTISGAKTLSGATTMSSTVTLSGVNADTATSSGQKLAVLNTTTNTIERVNITPDTLINSNTAQTITGIKSFNSDCLKVNNIYALGTRLTLKDSSTSSFDLFFNNKVGTSINAWCTIDVNGVGNPPNQGLAIWSDFHVQGTAEITSALKLSGVNADTTTSSGQKLAVLNTTTNTVERVNITPDTLVNSNTAQTITGIKSFNSDCMKVNNIFALGTSLTVKNSGATSFDIIFNSKFTNTEPGWLTIDPNNTSAASTGIAFYGNLCIQENTEIMKILALTGTNTDTSISSGQKLTVLNTSTHAIERVNITANNVATLSGTQTFSGDKTFTGTVNLGTVNTSGRVSASYTLNTTTSFQTIATLNSTGMYLMTASTNAADGTHGLYYICMEEGSMIVALSANNFAFQFVSGTTLQVRTVSQGFNNCEINILRLK